MIRSGPNFSVSIAEISSAFEAPKVLVERTTKETKVLKSLSLDGGLLDQLPNSSNFPSPIPDQKAEHHASRDSASQQIWIWTRVGFLDHMLQALAKHASWSLHFRTLTSELAYVDGTPY